MRLSLSLVNYWLRYHILLIYQWVYYVDVCLPVITDNTFSGYDYV